MDQQNCPRTDTPPVAGPSSSVPPHPNAGNQTTPPNGQTAQPNRPTAPNWTTPPKRNNAPPPNRGTTPPGWTPPPGWPPPPPGWVPPGPAAPIRRNEDHFCFPNGRKELFFALFALITSLLVCNFTLFGGFNLGFGIAVAGYILCGTIYLMTSGYRPTLYSTALLLLSIVIAAGFGRSDDGGMKFFMLLLLFVSVNLGMCITAEQNIYRPGSIRTIGDLFRTIFPMCFGQIGRAIGGLFGGMKGKGSLGKKIGAMLLGILITVPLLGIVMSLLVEADAAFEAMMEILPDINFGEAVITVLMGVGIFIFMYSRCTALVHRPKAAFSSDITTKGINKWTVNTVLTGVCLVYLLYLVSQLAYFISGFSGIVPRGYTLAEYARRGFFEMTWLCVINLSIIIVTSLVIRKSGNRVPLGTRFLCLFIGLVTLFMVAVASAKMWIYIGGYGLTRARVLTQLIIVFFGIAAISVSISQFTKKPRYMQVLIITALLLGGAAFWADVDTVVATYNVNAYLEGDLETVDVEYLSELTSGAIPQIARLAEESEDPDVVMDAVRVLQDSYASWDDFRDWNYARGQASECLKEGDWDDISEEELWKDYFESME